MSLFADVLKGGGTCVFPCDTVWGILGLARKDVARRICELKRRPENMGFVVLIPNLDSLGLVCGPLNSTQQDAVDTYLPGPVSLVLPKSDGLPGIVCGGRESVAVRLPEFGPLNDVLDAVGAPLISTSANLHGEEIPKTILEMDARILEGVDAVFEEENPPLGVASRIIDCMGEFRDLR